MTGRAQQPEEQAPDAEQPSSRRRGRSKKQGSDKRKGSPKKAQFAAAQRRTSSLRAALRKLCKGSKETRLQPNSRRLRASILWDDPMRLSPRPLRARSLRVGFGKLREGFGRPIRRYSDGDSDDAGEELPGRGSPPPQAAQGLPDTLPHPRPDNSEMAISNDLRDISSADQISLPRSRPRNATSPRVSNQEVLNNGPRLRRQPRKPNAAVINKHNSKDGIPDDILGSYPVIHTHARLVPFHLETDKHNETRGHSTAAASTPLAGSRIEDDDERFFALETIVGGYVGEYVGEDNNQQDELSLSTGRFEASPAINGADLLTTGPFEATPGTGGVDLITTDPFEASPGTSGVDLLSTGPFEASPAMDAEGGANLLLPDPFSHLDPINNFIPPAFPQQEAGALTVFNTQHKKKKPAKQPNSIRAQPGTGAGTDAHTHTQANNDNHLNLPMNPPENEAAQHVTNNPLSARSKTAKLPHKRKASTTTALDQETPEARRERFRRAAEARLLRGPSSPVSGVSR